MGTVPPSSGLVPPSQRCGLCQNFKQTTLSTRLYKVRTNLYPHLRKRSDAPGITQCYLPPDRGDIPAFRHPSVLGDVAITGIRVLWYRSELGGIYVDPDVLVLRSFDRLRRMPLTLARQSAHKISNGIIVSGRGSVFLRLWLETYRTFNPGDWSYHSTQVPARWSSIQQWTPVN